MGTINSKLIDKYNYELKPISYLNEINSDYVVLINTNTDGTAGTNKKVKIGLLKDYMNLSYNGDISIESNLQNQINELKQEINNKVNESLKSMQELTGDLETRVNTLEHLISLT